MPFYEKKRMIVDARQFYIGIRNHDELLELAHWCGGEIVDFAELILTTIQGEKVPVHPGEWIILESGAPGRAYPCHPDVFAATYDAVA